MQDINGEEFLVGDRLKVIKLVEGTTKFSVGDVVQCIDDDDSECCKFSKLGEDPEEGARWVANNKLQKL